MGSDANEATVKQLARELRAAEQTGSPAEVAALTHALVDAQAKRDEAFGVRVDARRPMPWTPNRTRRAYDRRAFQ